MPAAPAKTEQPKSSQLTIRQQIESDGFRQSIAQVLPKHLTPERMAKVAVAALTRVPLLKECDQVSFFRCLMELSQWGLEPDGRRAHLIPFKNSKRNCYEVQVIIDYKGLVELALRSGLVSVIHADVVCPEDEFIVDRGELICHRVDYSKPRSKPYAAYARIKMRDGAEKCEVMSREDIESVRKRSKAGQSGPWVTDWNEMAKKTAFRRASKWLPLSAEVRDAVERDDDVLDVTHRASVRSKPVTSLEDLTDRLTSSEVQEGAIEPAFDEEGKPLPLTDDEQIEQVHAALKLAKSIEAVEGIRFEWADCSAINDLCDARLKGLK